MNDSPLPPQPRTAASAALQTAPVGELTLQRCRDCGAANYPPRERCAACLGEHLDATVVDGLGTVVAAVNLHHSLETYFQTRLPRPLASVKLDCGPVAMVALRARDNCAGRRVRVALAHAVGGGWILIAADPTQNLRDGAVRNALLRDIGYGETIDA